MFNTYVSLYLAAFPYLSSEWLYMENKLPVIWCDVFGLHDTYTASSAEQNIILVTEYCNGVCEITGCALHISTSWTVEVMENGLANYGVLWIYNSMLL